MRSAGTKVVVFAALVAVCVFFGIDLATSGIERVGGPIGTPQQTASTSAPAAADAASGPLSPTSTAASATLPASSPSNATPPTPLSASSSGTGGQPSLINRLSLKLGDVLRALARGAIRFVTAVFNAIVH